MNEMEELKRKVELFKRINRVRGDMLTVNELEFLIRKAEIADSIIEELEYKQEGSKHDYRGMGSDYYPTKNKVT